MTFKIYWIKGILFRPIIIDVSTDSIWYITSTSMMTTHSSCIPMALDISWESENKLIKDALFGIISSLFMNHLMDSFLYSSWLPSTFHIGCWEDKRRFTVFGDEFAVEESLVLAQLLAKVWDCVRKLFSTQLGNWLFLCVNRHIYHWFPKKKANLPTLHHSEWIKAQHEGNAYGLLSLSEYWSKCAGLILSPLCC